MRRPWTHRWLRPGLLLVALPGCLDWASLYRTDCGNGVVELGEECDDGNAADTDACLSSCRWATCGDGIVRAGVEECEPDPANAAACTARCLSCTGGSANYVFPDTNTCYSRYDATMSWSDAQTRCDRARSFLVTYGNNHETNAVVSALLNAVTVPTWIGMRDQTSTGAFEWISGELALTTRWGIGEPMGPTGGCVVQRGRPYAWGSVACSSQYGYLCEKAPIAIRPEDRHAYLPLFGRLTWQEAVDSCREKLGHLVTIGDQAEQTFVSALTAGEFWIGARRMGAEGEFTWLTGEPMTATFFAPGEPDYFAGAGCLMTSADDAWYDRRCDDTKPYLCEFD